MQDTQRGFVGFILRRPLFAGITASLFVVTLGLVAATPGIGVRGDAESPDEVAFTFEQTAASYEAAAPSTIPDLAFTDQDGHRVRLHDQAGKVVLVNFITTGCTTVCIQSTRELRRLQQALGDRMGREVVFLSIALDADWDTPEAMRKFADRHTVDFHGWSFLSGSREELESARKAFGAVAFRGPTPADGPPAIEHTATTYVVDRQGLLRKQLPPAALALAGLQEIETVLASDG